MPWPAETPIDASSTGDNVIIAGVTDQSVRVWQLFFVVSTTTIVTIKSGSTALTGPITLTGGGSVVLDFVRGSREADQPWFTTEPGDAFVIEQSGSAQISGRLYYSQGLPLGA